jgi:hypothetical protein
MCLRRHLLFVPLVLAALVGCQSSRPHGCCSDASCVCAEVGGTQAAGAPAQQDGQDQYWGGLLRTGAIQLGPGVGRNLWRWQGDGQWGF